MDKEVQGLLDKIENINDLKTMNHLLFYFENTNISQNILKSIKQPIIDCILQNIKQSNNNNETDNDNDKDNENNNDNNNTDNDKIETIKQIYRKSLAMNTQLPFVVLQLILSFFNSVETCRFAVVCEYFNQINQHFIHLNAAHDIIFGIQSNSIDIARSYGDYFDNQLIDLITAKRIMKYVPRITIFCDVINGNERKQFINARDMSFSMLFSMFEKHFMNELWMLESLHCSNFSCECYEILEQKYNDFFKKQSEKEKMQNNLIKEQKFLTEITMTRTSCHCSRRQSCKHESLKMLNEKYIENLMFTCNPTQLFYQNINVFTNLNQIKHLKLDGITMNGINDTFLKNFENLRHLKITCDTRRTHLINVTGLPHTLESFDCFNFMLRNIDLFQMQCKYEVSAPPHVNPNQMLQSAVKINIDFQFINDFQTKIKTLKVTCCDLIDYYLIWQNILGTNRFRNLKNIYICCYFPFKKKTDILCCPFITQKHIKLKKNHNLNVFIGFPKTTNMNSKRLIQHFAPFVAKITIQFVKDFFRQNLSNKEKKKMVFF